MDTPSLMQPYDDLCRHVLQQGTDLRNTRTGQVCRFISGAQLQFDLGKGFPALTTRQVPFKGARGELLGFWRGLTNASDYEALGCMFWRQNADETKAWLNSPFRKGPGDLGRIYSAQWTALRDRRIVSQAGDLPYFEERGYTVVMHDASRNLWLVERLLNQTEEALRRILTDPSDRRILVNGWRAEEEDESALLACHTQYVFIPNPTTGYLDMTMSMRSCDLYLGLPTNIMTSSLMLEVYAGLAGYKAGTLTMHLSNAHVYESHMDQMHQLLQRSHLPQPLLVVNPRVQKLSGVEDIPGCLKRIEPSDLTLLGYCHQGALPAPMAA